MKVLAFDTSSKALSLAILEDKAGFLPRRRLNIKKNHSNYPHACHRFFDGKFGLDAQGFGPNRGGGRAGVATQAYELRSQRLRLWLIP